MQSNNRKVEITVGIFVLLGFACIAYLTVRLGKMDLFTDEHYFINAKFDSVAGLKKGAFIEMAGVRVGQVEAIKLDQKDQRASVTMKIRQNVKLTDEVIASIKTSGLIGDKYIMLTPGYSEKVLVNGDTIFETESAVDIEALISKYVFGKVE